MTIHPHILDSCWLEQFLRLSLFLMALTILRAAQEFSKMSPNLDLSHVFLIAKLGDVFWGERHRGEVPFSSHHIKGTCSYHDLLLLTLITWLSSTEIFVLIYSAHIY